MSFDKSELRVIFAEDEYVFREIAEPEIISAGVKPENLYMVEDGCLAYQKVQELGSASDQMVLMILDMRMPGMDGRQCALKTRELVAGNKLRVEPFLVCCSASNIDTKVEAEGAVFHMTVPKPFSTKQISSCLQYLEEWKSTRPPVACASPLDCGTHPSSSSSGRSFSLENADVIIVEDEPTISMTLVIELTRLGACSDKVTEAEDDDEMIEALQSAKNGDSARPLLVMAGKTCWADKTKALDMGARAPFIVLVTEETSNAFHARIPRPFKENDLKDMLAKSAEWWCNKK